MHIDHILPKTQGGTDSLDNLCLACPSCNHFKHDFYTAIDSDTQLEYSLFNPRQDQWTEHFQWSEDATQLIGLTPVGRVTIQRLKMNAPKMMKARRVWAISGWHPPKD